MLDDCTDDDDKPMDDRESQRYVDDIDMWLHMLRERAAKMNHPQGIALTKATIHGWCILNNRDDPLEFEDVPGFCPIVVTTINEIITKEIPLTMKAADEGGTTATEAVASLLGVVSNLERAIAGYKDLIWYAPEKANVEDMATMDAAYGRLDKALRDRAVITVLAIEAPREFKLAMRALYRRPARYPWWLSGVLEEVAASLL